MLEAKLVSRSSARANTQICIGGGFKLGGREIGVIGGPCAVESEEQMDAVATSLAGYVQMVRGGVYKPRSSPYSFQGLGAEGLSILSSMKTKHKIPVVSEVMSIDQIDSLSKVCDLLQVGSRNMQNFDLLKALGKASKPVLLKRGLSATIEEFLLAAEYIASHGNPNLILCERGIRSFDNYTRNVLDLGAVVALKQLSHLPVIVDPSHACGKSELVAGLARAAIAAGADGLIIEAHPEPARSVSDARQALSLQEMRDLVNSLVPLAQALGRRVQSPAAVQTQVLPMPSPRRQAGSVALR